MSYARYLSKLAALLGSDGTVQPSSLSTGHPTWDSSGNFGVGTGATALTALLTLQASSQPTLQFTDVGTGAGRISMTNAMIFGVDGSDGSTERMRIDSNGKVSIGPSVAALGQGYLSIYSDSAGAPATSGSSDAYIAFRSRVSSVALDQGTYGSGTSWIQNRSYVNYATNYDLVLQPNGGNVGIGTSSPESYSKLHVVASGPDKAEVHVQNTSSAQNSRAGFRLKSTASTYGGGLMMTNGSDSAYTTSALSLMNYDNQPLLFGTNNTERARIDSIGNLLVGTSTTYNARINVLAPNGYAGITVKQNTAGDYCIQHDAKLNSGKYYFHYYLANGTFTGELTSNGTTMSLSSASDYRLKEDPTSVEQPLSRVMSLTPRNFRWKSTGQRSDGFFAHELQAVEPECVSGDKDEVNSDGTPKYQCIDTTKLIPLMVAAIQEQQAIIEGLTSRITALESA